MPCILRIHKRKEKKFGTGHNLSLLLGRLHCKMHGPKIMLGRVIKLNWLKLLGSVSLPNQTIHQNIFCLRFGPFFFRSQFQFQICCSRTGRKFPTKFYSCENVFFFFQLLLTKCPPLSSSKHYPNWGRLHELWFSILFFPRWYPLNT